MMLDVPAVDLRANAWIAARYGVARWFYWESTYWFDDGRGGARPDGGFDPFAVAETFHDADGDWANGDGILVYPGKQIARGMIDYGSMTVFASVRLKNLRRGIEDAAYIALAREADRAAADAIVRRVIPRALANAPEGSRAAWPERGAAWIEARRALAAIAETRSESDDKSESDVRGGRATEAREVDGLQMSDGCSVKSARRANIETSNALEFALVVLMTFALRARGERSPRQARTQPPPWTEDETS
jgi:hypothetical protein